MPPSAVTLSALRTRIADLEGEAQARAVLPFGVPALDRRLPQGGLALGCLHEVRDGSGKLNSRDKWIFRAPAA